jgi:hypothetical protein
MLDAEWVDSPVLAFFTDASTEYGYGAYFGGEWFKGKWDAELCGLPIAVLEMFAITLALTTWGEKLRNKKLIIWSDNQCATNIIAKQASKCPILSFLLREFTLACLNFNVWVKPRYISSASNILADCLSRNLMTRFWAAAPTSTQRNPTPTPAAAALQLALKSAGS